MVRLGGEEAGRPHTHIHFHGFAPASHLILLLFSTAKLVLIAKNCPPLRKSEIEYYAMLAACNVMHYGGNNISLGTACGKYFRASVLTITDQGDSDIFTTSAQ